MEKEAKSVKSAALPLLWLEFGGGGEIKSEIIEALAHDLGKASQGRFQVKLFDDRGDSVEEHVHQEGKSVVQVHGWANAYGVIPKPQLPNPKSLVVFGLGISRFGESAEEGRNDINTKFFAEGKKGTFL